MQDIRAYVTLESGIPLSLEILEGIPPSISCDVQYNLQNCPGEVVCHHSAVTVSSESA